MGTGDYIREEVRDEIKHLRWRLQQTENERDRLREERDRLRDLIKELIDNDPYEQISDGGSVVLDAWRHEAKKVLEGKE